MNGLGWQEIFLIMLVTVIVLGPKHIPEAVRSFMVVWRRFQAMAFSLRREIDGFIDENQISDIGRDLSQNMAVGEKILTENGLEEEGPQAPPSAQLASPPASRSARLKKPRSARLKKPRSARLKKPRSARLQPKEEK